MRAPLIVPIAALVLFPARAEDGQASGSGFAIAVLMQFDKQYSAVSLAAMQQELESIMSACSLNIQWRVLDGSASRESFSDLVVTRFRGECRANLPRSPRTRLKTRARPSHTGSTAARDEPMSTSLRSGDVLDVPSSTPPGVASRPPRIHGLLTRLVTTLREKGGLGPILFT